MYKKLLFFFLFFIFNYNFSYAQIESDCNKKIPQDYSKKIDNNVPKIIEIEIKKNRKWQKNNYRMVKSISLNDFVVIPKKYKKKFNAKLKVKFAEEITCTFNAVVRQHGKMADHIGISRGNLFQSVDVDLKNGHINGITKFILFRPGTRKNPEDEIFLTELLRILKFLAPRTNLIDVKLNNLTTRMLFQEQAEKELLEYNSRKEGPILEGDERYFFLAQERFDSKQARKSFGKISKRSQLARQTNSPWASRGAPYKNISHEALTQLNLFYLITKNVYRDPKNSHIIYNINLDNNLLAPNNPTQISKLNIYNAILLAANGYQGLIPGNRKFYWDSANKYFEPIYYDGKLAINEAYFKPLRFELVSFPEKNNFLKGIKKAKKLIEQVKMDILFQEVRLRGSELSKIQVQNKLKQIIKKLSDLETQVKNDNTEKELKYDFNTIKKETLINYMEATLKIGSNLYLVFRETDNNSFKACNNKTFECKKINLTETDTLNLLKGRLIKNENIYQYIGEYSGVKNDLLSSSLNKIQLFNYDKIKFKNTNFYFDKNITYEYDENSSTFNIYQKYSGARAYFEGGDLNNTFIQFFGLPNSINQPLNNYPFDQKGLTGCLSFIDLDFKGVSIETSNSNCEDAINLTNTSGYIKKIESNNSAKDALDIDFSNIKIDKIFVNNAQNDCVDLSYGKYEFKEMNLTECGDKGISIGEKSNAILNKAIIVKSNIGIAVKDSSIVKLNNAKFKNLKTCISAYNKKQEFSGAMLKIKSIKCENYSKKKDIDKFSKIVIQNEF